MSFCGFKWLMCASEPATNSLSEEAELSYRHDSCGDNLTYLSDLVIAQ